MFFPFIRKVPLPVCLVLFLFISVLSHSTKAQGFEDDPLFGDDEIGFEETSGDFQDDNFGVLGDFLDPAIEGEGDPFAPVDDEDDLYIDEESFDIDTEQAFVSAEKVYRSQQRETVLREALPKTWKKLE